MIIYFFSIITDNSVFSCQPTNPKFEIFLMTCIYLSSWEPAYLSLLATAQDTLCNKFTIPDAYQSLYLPNNQEGGKTMSGGFLGEFWVCLGRQPSTRAEPTGEPSGQHLSDPCKDQPIHGYVFPFLVCRWWPKTGNKEIIRKLNGKKGDLQN